MAGTFLGVQDKSQVDTAGVASVNYDQARSDATASCNQTPMGEYMIPSVAMRFSGQIS